jgi:hypothetical protein
MSMCDPWCRGLVTVARGEPALDLLERHLVLAHVQSLAKHLLELL